MFFDLYLLHIVLGWMVSASVSPDTRTVVGGEAAASHWSLWSSPGRLLTSGKAGLGGGLGRKFPVIPGGDHQVAVFTQASVGWACRRRGVQGADQGCRMFAAQLFLSGGNACP